MPYIPYEVAQGPISDEERLRRVLELSQQSRDIPDTPTNSQAIPAPPPADVVPPSQAMVRPDQSYQQRADALEQQAAPPNPYAGMGRGKEFIMRALAGAAGGAIHAQEEGGYTGYLQQQHNNERQREQDLLGRAKELRGEGYTRERAFAQDQEKQQALELDQRRYEQVVAHQTEQERVAAEAARNKIEFAPPGSQPFKGGEPFGTAIPPRPLTGSEKGLQHVPGMINGKATFAVFNPNPQQGEGRFTDPATGADVSATFQPQPPPGQFLVGPTGEVTSIGNPRTGDIRPVSNPPGARRNPIAPGTLKEQRDMENSVRKIDELGTKFKEDFVGPGQGRYLNVKSKLPFGTLPEGYGDFIALQADLKNTVIKLITGAQMGQQEASRILQQVPTEVDRPEMWRSKYNQTKENAKYLLGLIEDQTGTVLAPNTPPSKPPSGGLPKVGDTFQGGKVIKVTPIP